MFDLEQAIAEWRRRMRAAGLKSPALLDELESHLRDETARQMQSGSAAPEAFEFAVRQMGSADALKAEFAKARIPDLAKLRAWAAVAYSAELAAYTVFQMRHLSKSALTHGELLLAIAGLAATLLAAYGGWRLAPRLMNCIPNQTIRRSLAIAGSLSGSLGWMAIFAWVVLPYVDCTPGQFAVVVLWAMLPMVTSPTLILGTVSPEGERAR